MLEVQPQSEDGPTDTASPPHTSAQHADESENANQDTHYAQLKTVLTTVKEQINRGDNSDPIHVFLTNTHHQGYIKTLESVLPGKYRRLSHDVCVLSKEQIDDEIDKVTKDNPKPPVIVAVTVTAGIPSDSNNNCGVKHFLKRMAKGGHTCDLLDAKQIRESQHEIMQFGIQRLKRCTRPEQKTELERTYMLNAERQAQLDMLSHVGVMIQNMETVPTAVATSAVIMHVSSDTVFEDTIVLNRVTHSCLFPNVPVQIVYCRPPAITNLFKGNPNEEKLDRQKCNNVLDSVRHVFVCTTGVLDMCMKAQLHSLWGDKVKNVVWVSHSARSRNRSLLI